jgi:hypothetical protein
MGSEFSVSAATAVGSGAAECEQRWEVTVFDGAWEQIWIANLGDGGEAKFLCIDGKAGELFTGDGGSSDRMCGGTIDADQVYFSGLAFMKNGG